MRGLICFIFGHKMRRCGNKQWKMCRLWSTDHAPKKLPYRNVKKKCTRCGFIEQNKYVQIID